MLLITYITIAYNNEFKQIKIKDKCTNYFYDLILILHIKLS